MTAPQPGLAHVACAVCGAEDARVRWETLLDDPTQTPLEAVFRCTNTRYGRFGRIVQCRRCGLLYRDPQEADLLDAYAAAVDDDYLEEWQARRSTFQRSLRQLSRYAHPPGDLLDVGCSTGFFLRVAAEAGWHAVGLEPSRWAVEQARSDGLEVYEGVLGDSPIAGRSFDVVTLWDVLEHVRDPREVLQAAWGALRPGGVLGLTTMDVGSLVARLLGPRWPHLMRMHLWYFRRRHILALLREDGFEEIAIRGHVRVLSAGYLASRLSFASARVGRLVGRAVDALGLSERLVPIALGDLIAVYARKPGEPAGTA